MIAARFVRSSGICRPSRSSRNVRDRPSKSVCSVSLRSSLVSSRNRTMAGYVVSSRTCHASAAFVCSTYSSLTHTTLVPSATSWCPPRRGCRFTKKLLMRYGHLTFRPRRPSDTPRQRLKSVLRACSRTTAPSAFFGAPGRSLESSTACGSRWKLRASGRGSVRMRLMLVSYLTRSVESPWMLTRMSPTSMGLLSSRVRCAPAMTVAASKLSTTSRFPCLAKVMPTRGS
mmetsp:Transcript_7178/g.21020  ORF Transcript_7178/g.21020 Transcript_7178/m.21020 type:complete len:229 (+) Transcript_7178:1000-1686(+)